MDIIGNEYLFFPDFSDYEKYKGELVMVKRELSANEVDEEIGPMYEVLAEDGSVLSAYPEELFNPTIFKALYRYLKVAVNAEAVVKSISQTGLIVEDSGIGHFLFDNISIGIDSTRSLLGLSEDDMTYMCLSSYIQSMNTVTNEAVCKLMAIKHKKLYLVQANSVGVNALNSSEDCEIVECRKNDNSTFSLFISTDEPLEVIEEIINAAQEE